MSHIPPGNGTHLRFSDDPGPQENSLQLPEASCDAIKSGSGPEGPAGIEQQPQQYKSIDEATQSDSTDMLKGKGLSSPSGIELGSGTVVELSRSSGRACEVATGREEAQTQADQGRGLEEETRTDDALLRGK